MNPVLSHKESDNLWVSDQGDGTYCNTIIHADYSDLDVIRVGKDFYLTATSFNCTLTLRTPDPQIKQL